MTRDSVSEAAVEEMLDELVVRGSDDWVMLTEVDWVVKSNAARHNVDLPTTARVSVGLKVLRRALQDGLMNVGSVSEDPPGFVPWDIDLPRAIDRMEAGWRAAGDNLQMGAVCWVANTSTGDARAEMVRQEVNARTNWPPRS